MDITIKINTVLILGVNETQIGKIARITAGLNSIFQVNGAIHDCVVHATIDLEGIITKGKF